MAADSQKNVINLKNHPLAKNRQPKEKSNSVPDTEVLDMTERRQEIIKAERRTVRRTILTEFIGAFIVVPGKGLDKVAIYDISEYGIAFDMDVESGFFKEGEEVAMRVYLNRITYFPFIVKIQNSRTIEDESVNRHGGSFIAGTVNDQALHYFVRFIETVSASLKSDKGDVMVSNLKK